MSVGAAKNAKSTHGRTRCHTHGHTQNFVFRTRSNGWDERSLGAHTWGPGAQGHRVSAGLAAEVLIETRVNPLSTNTALAEKKRTLSTNNEFCRWKKNVFQLTLPFTENPDPQLAVRGVRGVRAQHGHQYGRVFFAPGGGSGANARTLRCHPPHPPTPEPPLMAACHATGTDHAQ